MAPALSISSVEWDPTPRLIVTSPFFAALVSLPDVADRRPQSLGKDTCFTLIRVRQDCTELFAPVSANEVAGAPVCSLQRTGNAPEACITGRVPLDIVEGLEMIDVYHDQTQRQAAALRARKLHGQAFVDCPTVWQSG